MLQNKLVFITGASKGIGKALAKTYFENGFKVITFSRTKGDLPSEILQFQVDLSNSQDLENAFKNAFAEVDINKIKQVTLINNAGRLGKISAIDNIPLEDIALSVQLNVIAVMQLTGLFIKKFKEVNIIKNCINISSGAAVNPYAGWSTYCSSKAAIDMFTKTVALEQQEAKFPFKINGIRPGVVATDMQKQIRNTSKQDFKNVDKFISLYENKHLSSSDEVAKKIYYLDTNNSLDSGIIADLRDL